MKRVVVELDDCLHLWLKVHCAKSGISMRAWLAQVIAECREEIEKKTA